MNSDMDKAAYGIKSNQLCLWCLLNIKDSYLVRIWILILEFSKETRVWGLKLGMINTYIFKVTRLEIVKGTTIDRKEKRLKT